MKIKMKTMALVGLMGSALLLTGCGGGSGGDSATPKFYEAFNKSTGDTVSCDFDLSNGITCGGTPVAISDLSNASQLSNGDYQADYNGDTWVFSTNYYAAEVITDIAVAQVNGNDGSGVKTLVIDDFVNYMPSSSVKHGDRVRQIIDLVAPNNVNTRDLNVGVSGSDFLNFDLVADDNYYVNTADTINISAGALGYTLESSDITDLNDSFNSSAFVTIAAGNESSSCLSQSECNFIALAFTHNNSEWSDRTIVVGALNHDGKSLTEYSNRAGILKDHFISAPVFSEEDGTSFAAPLVNGVGALLHQNSIHGDKSSEQIKRRILTTADDLGVAGVDDIYGHGRLNVGRALAPVGNLH